MVQKYKCLKRPVPTRRNRIQSFLTDKEWEGFLRYCDEEEVTVSQGARQLIKEGVKAYYE